MRAAVIAFTAALLWILLLRYSSGSLLMENLREDRGKRSLTKEDDEVEDIPLPEYLKNCNQTYLLSSKSWTMLSPSYGLGQYPPGVYCAWNFIGSEECIPEISCRQLHLRKFESDCSSEYFSIRDGVGGQQRYCGRVDWDKFVRASIGARELFVEFVSGESATFSEAAAGFFCEARCANMNRPKEDIYYLPAGSERRKVENRCVCGLQNKNDRIVGGQDAGIDEFPWMAAIVKSGTRLPLCGSSLINDKFVITVASCLKKLNVKPKDIQVLLHVNVLDQVLTKTARNVSLGEKGSIRGSGYDKGKVTDQDERTKRLNVMAIITHPLFSAKTHGHDVALVQFESGISLSNADSPTPICLPSAGNFKSSFDGQIATVSGWGYPAENAGGTTRTLQKAKVPVIPLDKCRSAVPTKLGETFLCAGYEEGGVDACTGDLGSPLFYQQQNTKQWLQIGIVSWLYEGCARAKRPGLYTKLTEVSQWIYYRANQEKAMWCGGV